MFFNPSYKPRYITVDSWVLAGMPPNCFVYDSIHQLLASGIPIADAVEVEGRWIRTPISSNVACTVYVKQPKHSRKCVRTSTIELVEHEFITSADAKRRKLR